MNKEITPTERQQSLASARIACERLREYKFSVEEVFRFQQRTSPGLGLFCYTLNELMSHLIAGFEILDEKELRQAEAGREFGHLGAKHGKKGGWKKGRPRTRNGGKK